MGRVLLVVRLAVRDLRRRPVEAALLLLAIMAATTTLTLGLVLRGVASDPYQRTRTATSGPDVIASAMPHPSARAQDPAALVIDRAADVARLEELAGATGVVGHSGPYPVTSAVLEAAGRTSDVQAVGRGTAAAPVDQPEVVQGSWLRDGGVVIEAAFADALDVRVGDRVTLDGRTFDVVGVAVTAAMAPHPASSCLVAPGCVSGATPEELSELPAGLVQDPGLVWLTEAGVRSLTTDPGALSYVMNLKLAEPHRAQSFVDAHAEQGAGAPRLESWQDVLDDATERTRDAQVLLMIGAWLLGLLAVASISVLVGGRMAEQTRRVGLLKAVGGTPNLVAAVLLAEYVLVAVAAGVAGLAVGSLTAPLLAESSAGLIGGAGAPPITGTTVASVMAVAVGVAAGATLAPAVRAARTSTVHALADAARPPRRTGWLIGLSARLPVPLLLAVRVAGRRPRRVVLGVVSITITVSGTFVALVLNAELTTQRLDGRLPEAQADVLGQVLLVVMVIMFSLAAVNAIFITWATVLDNRQSSALARALGATPGDVSAALAAAQILPGLAGAVLGAFPGGFALFHAINAITGGDSSRATLPPLWQLMALVAGTVVIVAVLTAIPARLGGRRSVTEMLLAEHA
jgi:putative ABC transport system permease protein